jgi:hypothetical protein
MYKVAMLFGAVLIGGVVFLGMFPALRTGLTIDTTGWIPLFAAMVRFLPYVLIGLFFVWIFAKLRRG